MAVQLVCSEPIAREIVEETFSSAWQKLGSFANSAEIETWVHQSTVKAALERAALAQDRSGSSHDHRLVLAMGARKLKLGAKSDNKPDPIPGSRRSVEFGRRVQRIVDALPKGLRAVLVLCDMEEMAPGELENSSAFRAKKWNEGFTRPGWLSETPSNALAILLRRLSLSVRFPSTPSDAHPQAKLTEKAARGKARLTSHWMGSINTPATWMANQWAVSCAASLGETARKPAMGTDSTTVAPTDWTMLTGISSAPGWNTLRWVPS